MPEHSPLDDRQLPEPELRDSLPEPAADRPKPDTATRTTPLVVVTAVEPDGPAAEQGLQTGNVILEVGGKSVGNASDMRNALSEAKSQGKHQVLMRVKTGDATRFAAVPLGNA